MSYSSDNYQASSEVWCLTVIMAAVASSVSYSPQSVGEPRLVSDEGPSLPHFSLVQLFSFEQFFG